MANPRALAPTLWDGLITTPILQVTPTVLKTKPTMKTPHTQFTTNARTQGAKCLALALWAFALSPGAVSAHTVLWFEGFETYHTDAGQTFGGIDKNVSGGPNSAPNGTPVNPWFGPNPNNGWITMPMTNPLPIQDLITPHGGQFMLRGSRNSSGWYSGWDADIDYVNIAYQFNHGATFQNYFGMDWWFFDELGSAFMGDADKGPGCFGDHAGLCYAAGAQTTTDYDDTNPGDPAYQGGTAPPLPFNGGMTARLAIGAYEDGTWAYDESVYQVQVQGATDGQDSGGRYADGWFNTTMFRSNGWHHAAITVDGNNHAVFSIDDVVVLVHDTGAPSGFNLFNTTELQSTPDNYNQSAYYDDITLSLLSGPTITNCAVSGTNVVLSGKDGLVGWTYVVSASTDITKPKSAWTDLSSTVLPSTGPFRIVVTNAVSAATPHRFFSLRANIVAP